MGLSLPTQTKLSIPQQPTQKVGRLTAPLGGVNTIDSIARMPPDDCIYAYNISPSEKGLQVRNGRIQHSTGLTGAVRTLIPFYNDTAANNAMFAVTTQGIYDVSASGAVGAILLTFGTHTGAAGWGVHCHYINDAGVRTLFYADEVNGLFEYVVGSGWVQTTGITGLNETDIVFITAHKLRLWVVDRSGDAWYLPVGTKAGAATKFIIGSKFKRGGQLVGLYNWTMDGGVGVDDYLVALSRGGDVLIYRGEDPSSATTWTSVGVWFCGRVPIGRRGVVAMGGSLHILSVYGLVDLGEMLKSSQAVNDVVDTTSSRKISPAIRTDIAGRIDNYGWDMVPIPSQGAFMITRPLVSGSPDLQYIEHTGLGSWSFWRGLPANCATEYNGIVYIGDTSGVVHKLQGGIDGVLLNGTGGMDVEFSFLTSFNDLQSPGIFKQPHFFRPSFISETGAHPVYTVTARFDYDFAEIATVPAGGASTGSLWDTATWDSGIWGGGIEASNKVLGGAGMGRTLALAVRGTSRDLAVFLDCDIVWSAGGSL